MGLNFLAHWLPSSSSDNPLLCHLPNQASEKDRPEVYLKGLREEEASPGPASQCPYIKLTRSNQIPE